MFYGIYMICMAELTYEHAVICHEVITIFHGLNNTCSILFLISNKLHNYKTIYNMIRLSDCWSYNAISHKRYSYVYKTIAWLQVLIHVNLLFPEFRPGYMNYFGARGWPVQYTEFCLPSDTASVFVHPENIIVDVVLVSESSLITIFR